MVQLSRSERKLQNRNECNKTSIQYIITQKAIKKFRDKINGGNTETEHKLVSLEEEK